MDAFQESIQLAPGIYLQASAQKFRLHRLLPWDTSPCQEPLMAVADLQVTRQMMAGAFYAGLSQRADAENKLATGITAITPSLLHYIHTLAGSWQTTHATPPTMRRVAQRLMERGQNEVAEHCLDVAAEESGHDTLALMDLAALGLPAQAFVDRVQPKNAVALVAQFTRFADSDAPIAVLGYAYTLERMALFTTATSIAAIERLMPAGVNATRCLRVHSAVGSDIGHVAESLELIAALPPQDRAAIVRAVYATTSLQAAATPDYPGDDAMRALLDEFEWSMAEQSLA